MGSIRVGQRSLTLLAGRSCGCGKQQVHCLRKPRENKIGVAEQGSPDRIGCCLVVRLETSAILNPNSFGRYETAEGNGGDGCGSGVHRRVCQHWPTASQVYETD